MKIPCLLAVDDDPLNLSVLVELFAPDYRILVARDGEQALRRAGASPRPDLILLDIMMPGMDGFEVCRRLKADTRTADIPVIFISALVGAADETRGIESGAIDYVTKPIKPLVVQARVRTHLALHHQARILEDEVAERTLALIATQDAIISALATLAETRDNETGCHIRRTQYYVMLLARALRHHPRFAALLTDGNIDLLLKSAPLHDIGKVGIPDRILLKPGKLTEDEFAIMQTHTTLGRDAIAAAEAQLGSNGGFLRFAREIAFSHHEKWDGSGYPLGLVGDAIPLSGRLMAVADVYDALTTKRVYKEAYSHETAAAIILGGRGSHFDPDIVDVFPRIGDAMQAIAAGFSDASSDIRL